MEKGRREEIAGWKLIGRILRSLGAAARLGGRQRVLRLCCLAPLTSSCWFVLLFPQDTLFWTSDKVGQNICDGASKKLSFRKK